VSGDAFWRKSQEHAPKDPTYQWGGRFLERAVIRCTADPAKADKRTRSKWSRVMRYAAIYKRDSEPLDQFVRRKGGINACAGRFSRRLGRRAPARTAG
jgi:hypothetical protein